MYCRLISILTRVRWFGGSVTVLSSYLCNNRHYLSSLFSCDKKFWGFTPSENFPLYRSLNLTISRFTTNNCSPHSGHTLWSRFASKWPDCLEWIQVLVTLCMGLPVQERRESRPQVRNRLGTYPLQGNQAEPVQELVYQETPTGLQHECLWFPGKYLSTCRCWATAY